MENLQKEFANEIANEIISRPNFNVEEISLMIQMRLKNHIRDILNEYSSKEEIEYMRLLTIQQNMNVGSKQYVTIGYDLAMAKKRLASVNRALNNVKREDRYQNLKNYILATFGEDAMNNINEHERKWKS